MPPTRKETSPGDTPIDRLHPDSGASPDARAMMLAKVGEAVTKITSDTASVGPRSREKEQIAESRWDHPEIKEVPKHPQEMLRYLKMHRAGLGISDAYLQNACIEAVNSLANELRAIDARRSDRGYAGPDTIDEPSKYIRERRFAIVDFVNDLLGNVPTHHASPQSGVDQKLHNLNVTNSRRSEWNQFVESVFGPCTASQIPWITRHGESSPGYKGATPEFYMNKFGFDTQDKIAMRRVVGDPDWIDFQDDNLEIYIMNHAGAPYVNGEVFGVNSDKILQNLGGPSVFGNRVAMQELTHVLLLKRFPQHLNNDSLFDKLSDVTLSQDGRQISCFPEAYLRARFTESSKSGSKNVTLKHDLSRVFHEGLTDLHMLRSALAKDFATSRYEFYRILDRMTRDYGDERYRVSCDLAASIIGASQTNMAKRTGFGLLYTPNNVVSLSKKHNESADPFVLFGKGRDELLASCDELIEQVESIMQSSIT